MQFSFARLAVEYTNYGNTMELGFFSVSASNSKVTASHRKLQNKQYACQKEINKQGRKNSSPLALKVLPYQNSGKLRIALICCIGRVKLHITCFSLHLISSSPPNEGPGGRIPQQRHEAKGEVSYRTHLLTSVFIAWVVLPSFVFLLALSGYLILSTQATN